MDPTPVSLLQTFFDAGNPTQLIYGTHSPWLVALSLGMAIFASTMALHVAGIARRLTEPVHQMVALGAGTVSLGCGVWAMHFIGMMAFDLCTPVQYDLGLTLASLIPALLASWVAFRLLVRQHVGARQLIVSGILVGTGIGAMHYSGMAAMQMTLLLRYDPWWFALSILAAIALSMLALWIRFGLRGALGTGTRARGHAIVLSGTVMGLAIASMHYLGMTAARFVAPPGFVADYSLPTVNRLALEVSLFTVIATMLVALASHMLLRYREMYQKMRVSESQYRSLLQHIPGLAYRRQLDEKRTLVFVSQGALALTGWSASECGPGLHDFREQIHPDDRPQVEALAHQAVANIKRYEVEYRLIHRDGSERWMQSSSGVVVDAQGVPRFLDGLVTDITERKAAQKALANSESQSRSLLRNIPGMAYRRLLEGTREMVYVSDSIQTLTGYSVQECMTGGYEISKHIHPEDSARVAAMIRQSREEHIPFETEYRLIHRDGSVRWVLSRGSVAYDSNGLPKWWDGMLTDITRRKTTETALHESKGQMSSMIRNIPGVTVRSEINEAWRIQYISAAVEEFTGWSVNDFLTGVIRIPQIIHPDDLQRVTNAILEAVGGHRSYSVEYRIRHRNGSLRWAWGRGGAIFDARGKPTCADSIIMDITERKDIEKALSDNAQQLRSLIKNMPGAALRSQVDTQWTIRYISDAIEELTGWPASGFIAGTTKLQTLIHPEEIAFVTDTVSSAVADHRSYSVEFRILKNNDSYRWVWARGSAVYDGWGKPVLVDSIIVDIEDRHAMEDKLREAKNRAEEAARSKTSFLANMSHEIRTPMNAVIGFTELLLGTDLTPLQRRHMGTVRQSARSLLGLLNNILDTAKLEKEAVELEHQDFSLLDLVTEVADAQRLTAETKNIQLVVDYDPGMPEFFKGDSMRVQQVLTNLVGNAVKFTSVGAVRLQVKADGELVHIAVHDTGIGIAADRLEKIFDPFSQADASMSRRFGGTGLGTTIARQLVELMQGSLQVQSTLGVGSVFHVRLPLKTGMAFISQPDIVLYELPSLRVLAVDDVPQNLELLSLALGKSGHHVTCAEGGRDALKAFENGSFDVILMDVQMPDMDGLKATRLIREIEHTGQLKPTPVVALTASVLEEDRRATREAGMDGFASKPIDLPRLYLEIARVTGFKLSASVGATLQALREERSRPPTTTAMAIDWTRGVALWGSASALERNIRQFMRENQAITQQLAAQLQQGLMGDVQHLAHRLRGAAGNLCLQTLLESTAALEAAVKERRSEQAHQALETVEVALVEIWRDIEANSTALHPTPSATMGQDNLDITSLRGLLLSAQASTQRNEIDEATQEQLLALLRAHGQNHRAALLDNALMSFEFEAAQQQLDSLIQQLDQREEPS